MKKLIVAVIVILLVFNWARNAVESGRFEKYLENHPNKEMASRIVYSWAVLFYLAQRMDPAEQRFRRVLKIYPDTACAPLAWSDLVHLLDDRGARTAALEEAELFLAKYPRHQKSDIIRKKAHFIQNGY